MKILVIQQKMIGDVLTSSILFEVLKKEFPNATLHYLIHSNTFSVVQHHPCIDEFIIFPNEAKKNTKLLFKFASGLQSYKYDVIIDVYAKLESILITQLSKPKKCITYRKPYTKPLYSHTTKRGKKPNSGAGLAIEDRLNLLSPLVKEVPKFIKPKIYLTPSELEKSKQYLTLQGLDLSKPIIMISVLGSHKNKTYPFIYMAEVIDTIADFTKAQLLFNYIPSQIEKAQTIYDRCKPNTQAQIFFSTYKEDIREFLGVLKQCQALIGNEGGAINMAKALEVKTFAIFSPWIDKGTWSIFEDKTTNVSVHLKDYMPELYKSKPEKSLKRESLTLYKKFTPDYFKNTLRDFLEPYKS